MLFRKMSAEDSPPPVSTVAPVPQVEIGSSYAPGKRGPVGTAPRTNYSRANTGAPPLPDAGAAAQKSIDPMSAVGLPKVAHLKGMKMNRPNIADIVKMAMAQGVRSADITAEALRQTEGTTKQAAPEAIDFEEMDKLAEALDFIADDLLKESADVGHGAGALAVNDKQVSGNLSLDDSGQATKVVPMSEPLDKGNRVPTNMANPAGMKGRQEIASKLAASVKKEEKLEEEEGKGMALAEKGIAQAASAHAQEKKATVARLRQKLAEDAINPAQISGGKAVPPDTSASGQPGGQPAGGAPQGATHLIGSNESAQNFTRRDAYAGRKTEMNSYLNEPMMSSAHDKVLKNVLSNGTETSKFASPSVRTLAGQALLQKLAEKADEESAKAEQEKKNKKEKDDCATNGMM